MAEPLWKSRPGEPDPATYGSQQINDFIHLSEGFSNSFLITTDAGRIIVNTSIISETQRPRSSPMPATPSIRATTSDLPNFAVRVPPSLSKTRSATP